VGEEGGWGGWVFIFGWGGGGGVVWFLRD